MDINIVLSKVRIFMQNIKPIQKNSLPLSNKIIFYYYRKVAFTIGTTKCLYHEFNLRKSSGVSTPIDS